MSDTFTLSDSQKRALLQIARETVEARVCRTMINVNAPDDPALLSPCGCFVTLHVDGDLRGCIGTFQASSPLYQTIREMAQASLQDPRFLDTPLQKEELDRLEIEISVLSPLVKTDDPLSLEVGKHGIYIRRGYSSGCFLPQVATEYNMSKEEFLNTCCVHKAGLPRDAWKDPKTEVFLFTAEVFREGEICR